MAFYMFACIAIALMIIGLVVFLVVSACRMQSDVDGPDDHPMGKY